MAFDLNDWCFSHNFLIFNNFISELLRFKMFSVARDQIVIEQFRHEEVCRKTGKPGTKVGNPQVNRLY